MLLDNSGNILFTAMIILVGVMLGLAVYGTFHGAEAVIGGEGNVTENGNPHNFSASSANIAAIEETRVCIFCHTSHGARTDDDLIDPPLWNHSLSSAVYNVLAPNTLVDSSVPPEKYPVDIGVVNLLSSPLASPDGSSRLCLGCHDGTIGIGNVVSEGMPIAMNIATSEGCLTDDGELKSGCSAYIGNDLTAKHAVSIPMNKNLIDESIANCGTLGQTTELRYPWNGGQGATVFLRPTLATFRGNPGIKYGDPGFPANYSTSTKYSYGVQCSTCHDPHWWQSSGVGFKFLVTSNYTDLCSACHKPGCS
jgi:predicted CXXCH cytochrome family protein